jgi:hypothetical protein
MIGKSVGPGLKITSSPSPLLALTSARIWFDHDPEVNGFCESTKIAVAGEKSYLMI